MSGELLLPAVAAALAGLLATGSHRRLRPPSSARLLAATLSAVTVAVVPTIVLLALGYVTHVSWFGGAMAWCRETLGLHHRVPAWLGLPAVAALVAGGVRIRRVRSSWRRFWCERSGGVQVVDSNELFAYTLPGPGGHIVVSSALVEELDDGELAVVIAHEQAHATHRHDRYLLVGATAVALVPLLAPLHRRLRFALERWADEDAVASLDVDRVHVARTVAAVALSGASTPAGAVGIVGLGVAGRVAALLDPPSTARSSAWMSIGVGGVLAVIGAAAVQAHHIWPLLASLCPG